MNWLLACTDDKDANHARRQFTEQSMDYSAMDNQRLQNSVALLEKTVMTLVKENDQLRNANNELTLKMSKLQGELSEAKRGLTDRDSQLSYLRQHRDASTTSYYGMPAGVERMQLQDLQREVQDLQLQLSDKKHEFEKYRTAETGSSVAAASSIGWTPFGGGGGDDVASLRAQIAERDQLIHQLNYQVGGGSASDYGLDGHGSSEVKMEHLRKMIAASAPKVARTFKT